MPASPISVYIPSKICKPPKWVDGRVLALPCAACERDDDLAGRFALCKRHVVQYGIRILLMANNSQRCWCSFDLLDHGVVQTTENKS